MKVIKVQSCQVSANERAADGCLSVMQVNLLKGTDCTPRIVPHLRHIAYFKLDLFFLFSTSAYMYIHSLGIHFFIILIGCASGCVWNILGRFHFPALFVHKH